MDQARLESGFAGSRRRASRAGRGGYADRPDSSVTGYALRGENSELTVPAPTGIDSPGLAEAFHRAHDRTYGYRSEEETVELINVRVIATGLSKSSRVPDELRSVVTAEVVRELEHVRCISGASTTGSRRRWWSGMGSIAIRAPVPSSSRTTLQPRSCHRVLRFVEAIGMSCASILLRSGER